MGPARVPDAAAATSSRSPIPPSAQKPDAGYLVWDKHDRFATCPEIFDALYGLVADEGPMLTTGSIRQLKTLRRKKILDACEKAKHTFLWLDGIATIIATCNKDKLAALHLNVMFKRACRKSCNWLCPVHCAVQDLTWAYSQCIPKAASIFVFENTDRARIAAASVCLSSTQFDREMGKRYLELDEKVEKCYGRGAFSYEDINATVSQEFTVKRLGYYRTPSSAERKPEGITLETYMQRKVRARRLPTPIETEKPNTPEKPMEVEEKVDYFVWVEGEEWEYCVLQVE